MERKSFVLLYLALSCILQGSIFAMSGSLAMHPHVRNAINTSRSGVALTTAPSKLDAIAQLPLEKKFDIVDSSCMTFLDRHYNDPHYVDHLAHNLDHLIIILRTFKSILGVHGNLPAYTMFKLFTDKIKACELVDYTVVEQIINYLPALVGHYFKEEAPTGNNDPLIQLLQTTIAGYINIIGPNFTQHKALSQNITADINMIVQEQLQNKEETMIARMRLRFMIMRFIDTLLSKVVWSQISYQSNWSSFLKIAHNLERLSMRGIIDHADDLDSLYWALVHRYCYFITLTGSFFPPAFYHEMEDDLDAGNVPFLYHEQDAVTPKIVVLQSAILQAKIKCAALVQGIVSDPVGRRRISASKRHEIESPVQ